MEAQPELALIAKLLNEHGLEAILIGNMAAALHGAPVTTVDIDFFFRKTPRNLDKLKAIAMSLGAILRPYYSERFCIQRERDGLQLNFVVRIDGAKSYEDVRARAQTFEFGDSDLLVSATAVVKSKRAAQRSLRDLIRFRLSLPPEKRLNVLRKKIGLTATCL